MYQQVANLSIFLLGLLHLLTAYASEHDGRNIQETFQLQLGNSVEKTIRISGENYTTEIDLQWPRIIHQSNHNNDSLSDILSDIISNENYDDSNNVIKELNEIIELTIVAQVTAWPVSTDWSQQPIMCLNNQTAATLTKPQLIQIIKINALEADFYSHRLNEGLYYLALQLNQTQLRTEANSTNSNKDDTLLIERTPEMHTKLYLSFFNLTSILHSGNIQNGQLHLETAKDTDDITQANWPYWQLNLTIRADGVGHTKRPCENNGVHNNQSYSQTNDQCICEKGYAGASCELGVIDLAPDYQKQMPLLPQKFALFRMPLDDLYTMVLEIGNTVSFNYFFSSVEDTEQHIQEKMIESMFSNITRIVGTSKTQQLFIPYNASISGFVFWFRNEHNQKSNLSVQFVKSSLLDFSSQFLTGLFNYILITLLGAFFLCICSFLVIYSIHNIRKRYILIQRKKRMESQLPKMRYSKYKQDENLTRDIPHSVCSVCLGDFCDDEDVRVTQCRHVFHASCIEEWAVTKNQCPMCREVLFQVVFTDIHTHFSRPQPQQQQHQAQEIHNNSDSQIHNNYANLMEDN